MGLLTAFLLLIFLHGLCARRLRQTVFTEPVIFTLAGLATSLVFPMNAEGGSVRGALLGVAELGLVLLLFTDASRTDLKLLGHIRNLPERLLSVGMLLSIALGALLAWLVIPGLGIWEGAILGAILAPTDAGLGQVIVTSPRVPAKIREALNVEAGLNDGLSVPFLLFFMAMAAAGSGDAEASLMQFVVEQLGYGILVGAGVGLVSGLALGWADGRGWTEPAWQHLSVVAVPLLALLLSEEVAASMFIAAFVAGLAVQFGFKQAGRHSVDFAEDWGRLLNLFVFFLFGNMAAQSLTGMPWDCLLYAVLSLTVVRMLPVAIALAGAKLGAPTVLFMGWFGPRGLASIVLGLVYLEQELSLPGEPVIRAAVTATVLLSIFAHGFSAAPGINRYERALGRLPGAAREGRE
jgi:NhaP-type Na+/H+ or K+/H+ antiporter